MIKLVALHYKLKPESLERYHNINQHYEALLFDWENYLETARATMQGYTEKPFVEPFEFEDSDYVVTEKKFRIRPQDILFYKENADNITELTTTGDISFTVKETVEEIDKLLE